MAMPQEYEWLAGLGTVEITPREPLWLAGYASRSGPSVGTRHPLRSTALALQAARGERILLLTTDLLGFSRTLWLQLEQWLAQRHGLRKEQVLLTASHNHCAPVIAESIPDYYDLPPDQLRRVTAYTAWLEEQLRQACTAALADLRPARLTAHEGVARFAVNRRNNREAEVQARLERGEPLAGPVDHTVPVLRVDHPDGTPRALVFGYACHTTTLNDYQWCGDYAGYAMLAVERELPEVRALFWAGCGGDQNPLPRRTVELCERYGRELAAAVTAAAATGTGLPLPAAVTCARRTVSLPYERVVPEEELRVAALGAGLRARWARRMLGLYATVTPAADYPYTVQAWRVGGELLWLALGGEPVVDYSHLFRREYGPHTWVTGYAFDLTAYMPSRRVWEEGGYEGGSLHEYAHPAERWAGDVEERIRRAVAEAVAVV